MRLLLVGEHALFVQGLVKLFHDHADVDVRATVQAGEVAQLVQGWPPSVLVAETDDVVGAESWLRRLRRTIPDTPLVLIAPNDEAQFLNALHIGARGFVGRDATASTLVNCVQAVNRGEWGLPRALLGVLVQDYIARRNARDGGLPAQLTPREQQILRLLARGLSTERIGNELYLSANTVRVAIRVLVEKLGVTNRAQLVSEAYRRGLITLD